MNYIDIHCHINFPEYDADREEVIDRARQAGVGMIVVGDDPESSQRAVDLAEKNPDIWAVVGFHPATVSVSKMAMDTDSIVDKIPDKADTISDKGVFDLDFYRKLGAHPKVVAIGECGLDYFHEKNAANPNEERELQKSVFEAQIRLAAELAKPLMLHVRSKKSPLHPTNPDSGAAKSAMSESKKSESKNEDDAYSDVISILRKMKKLGLPIAGDVHFFAGTADHARQFLELGFYLSFTGVITFAKEYHEIIRTIPLDRIMAETDAPFVSPIPYRGTRNEPSRVIEVVKAIAQIKTFGNNQDMKNDNTLEDNALEIVQKALVNNAKKLFNI